MLTASERGTHIHVRARLGWLEMGLPFLGTAAFPPWLTRLIAAPVHFIMRQRQLYNIKRRAEAHRSDVRD